MTLEAEFAEHAPFLRALARRLAAPSDAEDIVQDTYCAALDQPSRAGVIPWLVGVVKNRAARRRRSESRRRARELTIATDGTTPDTADVAARLEVARRLLQHVEALEPPLRDAVFLRYYEGLEPRHMAARLGAPLGTVKTRLARALARLRERLDADHPEGRAKWLGALAAFGGLRPGEPAVVLNSTAVARRVWLGVACAAAAAVTALLWLGPEPAPPQISAPEPAAAAVQIETQPPGEREALPSAAQVAVVAGVVEDAEVDVEPGRGQPAANVVVRARWRARAASTQPQQAPGAARAPSQPMRVAAEPLDDLSTTTDAHGRFRFELPAGATLDAVAADGTDTLRAARWSAASSAHDLPEQLLLTRYRAGRLEGVVVDPSGAPVASARVVLDRHADEGAALETTSDPSGRFVFAQAHADAWLTAERQGFVQFGASDLEARPRGGWQPARILLAPTATLAVEVLDAAGQPAQQVDNIVVVVGARETGLFAAMDCTPNPRVLTRAPVRDGRAEMTIAAGLELAVLAGASLFLSQRDGQGLTNASGQPIVVAAGEPSRLRLVLGNDVHVRVAVTDPDGLPVGDATVTFERVRDGCLERLRLATTDARGEFELPLASTMAQECLLITALGAGPTQQLRASRWLQVRGASPPAVELRLSPGAELVGHVRDAQGRALEARLHVALRSPEPGASTEREWLRHDGHSSTDANGAFRIPCPAGDVRLEVESRGFVPVVREDARAGAPLTVVLERAQHTRLRLRLPTPLDALEVDVAHLEASAGATPAWPRLDSTTIWSPAAHPAFAPQTPLRSRSDEGTWRRAPQLRLPPVDLADGRTFELQLERGPAMLSVCGRRSGSSLARLTTPPSIIAGDDVDLALPLTPTAACCGRIVFATGAALFPACIALADDHGRLLGISDLAHDPQEQFVLASSHGHFAIRRAPVGTWELRVGTRAELERGAARLRRQVTITAGANEPIVVEL